MLQFYGTYYHRIDEKGRVALPMKFRRVYEQAAMNGEIKSINLVITPSAAKFDKDHNQCLNVYVSEDFNKYIESLFDVVGGYNPRNKEHEMQMRALHANVEDVPIDSARRINIPQKFIEMAGLGKDVAIVGNSGHFEIWDAKRMETELESIDLEKLIYE